MNGAFDLISVRTNSVEDREDYGLNIPAFISTGILQRLLDEGPHHKFVCQSCSFRSDSSAFDIFPFYVIDDTVVPCCLKQVYNSPCIIMSVGLCPGRLSRCASVV